MRRLINYIRSCFCKHDWELLDVIDVYEITFRKSERPQYRKWVYRCKKCGCENKIES